MFGIIYEGGAFWKANTNLTDIQLHAKLFRNVQDKYIKTLKWPAQKKGCWVIGTREKSEMNETNY